MRFRTPGDIALALPMLLGYQPTESLVISCLHGDGGSLGLTLRYDLDTLGPPEEVAEEIASRAIVAGADTVLLAIYTSCEDRGEVLPYEEFVEALLDRPDVFIGDALLVRRDRWWSYLCADAGCCPLDGNPLDRDSAALASLEASLVLAGSAVLADREAVVASIASEWSADCPAQRRRIARARRRVAEMGPIECRRKLALLSRRLVTRLEDPRGAVTDAEAAYFAALCGDIAARDDLLIQAGTPAQRSAVMSVLRAVVRRVPPPHDAPVCAVLAWFGYAIGDGTLVNVALDRALASDPNYSLARLIESSLDRQIPPSIIEEVVRGAAGDIAARDAAG